MKEKDALREWGKKIREILGRFRYALVVIAAGLLLLLLPETQSGGQASGEERLTAVEEDFSVQALEEQLEQTLAQIDGAGRVQVMLTVQSGMKRVLAQDSSVEQDGAAVQKEIQTVVVSSGSGTQETVLVQQVYPQFQGALVVCQGGEDPSVRLKLTEAVAALTGLGADKISICKGK